MTSKIGPGKYRKMAYFRLNGESYLATSLEEIVSAAICGCIIYPIQDTTVRPTVFVPSYLTPEQAISVFTEL